MSFNLFSIFSKSPDYSFKVETKDITPQVKMTSYTRVHPDSVMKLDFIQGKPLICSLFFYDENGKKIEFTLEHDFSIKNGKAQSNSKAEAKKKIDGLEVSLQKSDLHVFKNLVDPHLEELEKKQQNIAQNAKVFFDINLRFTD